MKFKQFQNSINVAMVGSDIKYQTFYHGYYIVETVDGNVLVDREQTEYSSLEEAVSQIKHLKLQEDIQKEIQQELYEEMSDSKVADIIYKHHTGIKVTDTLIESYVKLASSKTFTSDPVAFDIRRSNKLDQIAEGCLDFRLSDGSVVVVREAVQQQLNNTFRSHPDVIEYMRESLDNFLSVLNQLEE